MCSYGCLDDLRNGVEVRDARRSAMAALVAAIVTVVAMLGWITSTSGRAYAATQAARFLLTSWPAGWPPARC